jgi:hypothetical protein
MGRFSKFLRSSSSFCNLFFKVNQMSLAKNSEGKNETTTSFIHKLLVEYEMIAEGSPK